MKILQILKENKIPYITSGKNIGKKAIASINCPFCGDDKGFHLGILELENNSTVYKCWRNAAHKGSIFKLLAMLLSISYSDAKLLLQEKAFINDDFFLDIDEKLCYNNNMNQQELIRPTYLELPKEAEPLSQLPFDGVNRFFQNYLNKRRIYSYRKFDIHFAISGDWRYRLIFPIYIDNKLVTWQARTIVDDVPLRYRDLEITKSIRHTKDCLYNYDLLNGGECLLITEGIFDVLRLSQSPSLHARKIDATCIFTTSIRDSQIALLHTKYSVYRNIVIMLDRGAESQALALYDKLSFLPNIRVQFMDETFEADDPGSMGDHDMFRLSEIIRKL